MERDLPRPSIKDYGQWLGISQEASAPSAWPFSVRWQDEQRIDKWLNDGFNDKNLIILGPPQAVEPGIRILTPVVEMARTMETMQKNGLGVPTPGICCPIYINAEVNHIPIEKNESMARNYVELAKRYFTVFHPDLPQPRLITDSQSGARLLRNHASQIKDYLSSATLDVLLGMAEKHSNGDTQESLIESTTAYLLAHYAVYGYVSMPEYYALDQQTLMLVPQSEQKFHNLMEAEIKNIIPTLPNISSPTNDGEGSIVIGYSNILKSAHYYPHQGERSLTDCGSLWPTKNQLSRQAGLNGRARDEIWEAVQLIETDTCRIGLAKLDAISKLQKEVLKI